MKPKLKDGARIIHRHCNVAGSEEGRNLIQKEADITGAEVHAWDDWYAIKPWGNEWVATPGGGSPKRDGYWGRYPGSKVQEKKDDGWDQHKQEDKKAKVSRKKREKDNDS